MTRNNTTERDKTYKAIRRQIKNCQSPTELNTSMQVIEIFSTIYGAFDEGSFHMQDSLLELHKEQSIAVARGKKQSLLNRFIRFLTT